MRTDAAFDVCWEKYREVAEMRGRIATVCLDSLARRKLARRGGGPREYAADFVLVGLQALQTPEMRSRRRLFIEYYVSGIDYYVVKSQLGISPDTFDFWSSQVKRRVGRELKKRGLFPPGEYFASHSA